MNPTKVELVLREAMEVSGLDSRNCGFFHVSDPLPQPEVADTIVSLVYQCVRDWRPDRRVQLWHLPFECVVAAPLRALDHLFPHATEAAAALEAFIACIEAPLLEHERLLADALVTPADIVGVLARVKLAQHRATVTTEGHTVTFLKPGQVRPPFPVGCPGTTPSGGTFTGAACVNSGPP